MNYKKILISSDFLMTKESEQENNLKWIYDLLCEVLDASIFMLPEKFQSGFFDNSFIRKEFFKKSNITLFENEMQFYFSSEEINSDSLSYLKENISSDNLIIGYELSEQTKTLLNQCGISYIDVWLHPVRYMDDILFAFKSNIDEINEKLKLESIDESYYKIYASRLKVQAYKGFKRSTFPLEKNSALFIGQTLNDKAVLSNGKMLTLLDFKEQFITLSKLHNVIYYSRHPFVKEGDEEILEFVTSLPNVQIIDKPAYELITRDEIDTVVTISSSVAIEAKFFNKQIIYFFKPPVEIGVDGYYSIYNKFCSTKFWSNILSSVIKTNNKTDVNFFDGKDKLRDALSFYWGYRHIDKTESLKITVGNLFKNKPSLLENGNDSCFDVEFLKKINNENINTISFDIFDTLVSRKTSSPRDIFRLLEKNSLKLFKRKINGLANLRIQSEDKLREYNLSEFGKQDISLDDIYLNFMELSGLEPDLVDKIKNAELEYELKFIEPRKSGIALFERAIRSQKDVILISDMYLPKEFLEKLLNLNGISGYSSLYVSCEYGLRKHEGDLYHYVLKERNLKANNILHIGDNIKGDIESAQAFGINTLHIPRAVELLKRNNVRVSNIIINNPKSLNFQQNIINGIYSNRFYDHPSVNNYKKSHFNSSPYELGYIALAPLVSSFCTQIKNICISRGIKEIAFLSRDGKIIKDAFDILFGSYSDIKTSYIYCSRRSTQIASISSRNDIHNILRKPVYSTTIYNYLFSRFGLDFNEIKIESLINNGLKTKLDNIGSKFNKESLENIVFEHEDLILKNAENERAEYIKYINENRSSKYSKLAIVDIGYSCSMQSFFEEYISPETFGFYLSTFSTALVNVDVSNTYSFISNLHNEMRPIHGINTHRFIYENLFCSDGDSFIRIYNGIPEFDVEDDKIRKNLVKSVHNGIRDFCIDITPTLEFTDNGIYLDPFTASALMHDFLKFPNATDALLFSGIKFQDGFASQIDRYLIPPQHEIYNDTIYNNAIWKEGASSVRALKSTPNNKKTNVTVVKNNNSTSNQKIVTPSKNHVVKPNKNIDKFRNAMRFLRTDRKKFLAKLSRHMRRVIN
jgi:predicted HAD superfamily hydrolase